MFHFIASTLTGISFIYCFIFVDKEGKGKRAAVKRFIWDGIPGFLKGCIKKCVGERGVKAWDNTINYMFYSRNPSVQFFYLMLAVGGYTGYVMYGFQHLPNQYASSIHKFTSIPLMTACYWSYYKACYTDPGYISKDTPREQVEKAMRRYTPDNILFSKTGWCDTCN